MIKRLLLGIKPAWIVAWRELRDQMRDWRIILPVITLTVFFPFLMNFTAQAAVDFASEYGTPLIGERFVPFLLMVVGFFPITVSLVIALEAFVGEKERGTIEPLLASPLKDWQLFLGKLFAAAATPLATSYLGIAVYLTALSMSGVPLPDINRLAQTILLTSAQAVLMVSGAILISTQATTVRAANLMSSFIVIPVALLIQGESILMFWGTNQILWLAVLAVSVMAALLIRVGLAHFQRETLLGREIDVLNIRWMLRTFWKAFRGEAMCIGQWYRVEVASTLRKQRSSILIVFVLGIILVCLAFSWAGSHSGDIKRAVDGGGIGQLFGNDLAQPGVALSFPTILWHNIWAILMIFLAGAFSFGVLGVILYLFNIGVIGVVIGILGGVGYSPVLLFLYGILPHGLFEIPALILTGGAMLHFGVSIVTPTAEKSLGESMLENLAAWGKVMTGVVLPLLVLAALIEAWVTPFLLLSMPK